MLGRKARLTRQDAEVIAAEGLAFLAGDPERLDQFVSLTGIDCSQIRTAAGTPAFLAAVLDYIVRDESILLAFAADTLRSPELIAAADQMLQRAD